MARLVINFQTIKLKLQAPLIQLSASGAQQRARAKDFAPPVSQSFDALRRLRISRLL